MNDPKSQPAAHDAPTPLAVASARETKPNKSADLSGKSLGDYQILRRLGRGGMAEVYLAQQGSLRRQVALKILRSQLADDNAYVQRFHREAQAAASLVHANIVQIYEVGQIDGYHYIAQEYVPGRNLRQHLQQSGTVDLPMAVSIMRQVTAALHKAATQQIVHRDIKPENIMLTAEGEVKVADFGLARIAGDADALHLTSAGVTMGTPLYMSPEQVESGEVDCRSDIYSLGVTCYHMLAGRPPFEGETAIAVALKHAKDHARPLGEHRQDIPAELADLVHAMLNKQPADRPQTPLEIMRQLRGMQLGDADGWSGEFDQWSGPELLALTRGSSATQQLQTLNGLILRRGT
jgi:serine/threonine-protein kinase